MARHQRHRSKPRKTINRYDPNAPDWHAVHGDHDLYRGWGFVLTPPPPTREEVKAQREYDAARRRMLAQSEAS